MIRNVIKSILEKIKIKKPKSNYILSSVSGRKSGLIIPKYCKCGNYKPISTKGIIIDRCRNCGGEKSSPRFG